MVSGGGWRRRRPDHLLVLGPRPSVRIFRSSGRQQEQREREENFAVWAGRYRAQLDDRFSLDTSSLLARSDFLPPVGGGVVR
jgi:hypothetical protein